DVARIYFTLRALDAEVATVRQTIELRNEQVRLVRSRFEGGIGNELNVSRAETELATAEADGASLLKRRAEIEYALAILVGQNPSSFRFAALDQKSIWSVEPPSIPIGLPGQL